jgi:hypothetical protein
LLTSANSCEDLVVRAHEQEQRGEQVVEGHVQFSGHSGHGTLRIVKLVSIIDEHTRECLTSLAERSVTADAEAQELATREAADMRRADSASAQLIRVGLDGLPADPAGLN